MYDWVVNCSIHKYHCRKYNIIFVCVAHIAFKIYRLQNCDFCGRNSCHFLFVSARSFEFDICTMCEWCTVTYVVNCIIEEFDYITTVLCVLFVSQSLVYLCASTLCPKKSEPQKHFATATANLHRFKWNFTHTRRHLFLSSTSNFIRISYSVYEMFNSFKLLSQISVTDTTYFLLTLSVVTGVTSVRVDKQTTCYQKRIEF